MPASAVHPRTELIRQFSRHIINPATQYTGGTLDPCTPGRHANIDTLRTGLIAVPGGFMLGGYISDLEAGDVFKPVEYVLTPLMASEYAHGVEENCEWFHSSAAPGGRQIRPPTMIHVDKMRILEQNCLKEQRVGGVKGPHARIHYEYHAKHHSPAYIGERLIVSGRITDRYVKRGRTYIDYYLEVHASDGRLITTYKDKTLLKYEPDGEVTK